MAMTDHAVRRDPPQLAYPTHTATSLATFIESAIDRAGTERAVVGLSGGIDSTVTATLATIALGSDRVTGLIMPGHATHPDDLEDARQVAEELVIDTQEIDVGPIVDTVVRSISGNSVPAGDARTGRGGTIHVPTKPRTDVTLARGNVAARVRMLLAYYEANTTDALVVGTGNYTELQVGYFTKYGDGGVDILPLGECYKYEVRQLARALEVRSAVIQKPSTAGLRPGQTDEGDLGATYDNIDTILWNLEHSQVTQAAIADAVGVSVDVVADIQERVEQAAHTRSLPPTPSDVDSALVPSRV